MNSSPAWLSTEVAPVRVRTAGSCFRHGGGGAKRSKPFPREVPYPLVGANAVIRVRSGFFGIITDEVATKLTMAGYALVRSEELIDFPG